MCEYREPGLLENLLYAVQVKYRVRKKIGEERKVRTYLKNLLCHVKDKIWTTSSLLSVTWSSFCFKIIIPI